MAGAGFLAGHVAHARWGDRAERRPTPAHATQARAAYGAIRAAEGDADRTARLRRSFLARWPDTWARAAWSGKTSAGGR